MRRVALSVLAMGFACAAAGAPDRPGATPRATAAEVPEDLVEAALVASGYTSAAARSQARRRLEGYLGGIVGQATLQKTEKAKGRALLTALHAKGALLGTYDARATTLRDVLEQRRYNCVSASVLYNLAARRAGLSVAAELLPTHARSMLSAKDGAALARVVVETTSPHGFDPDPATARSILDQVAGPRPRGARAIVSEEGELVNTHVLIGTIYVNRASIAQEAGDLEAAERLFARGQAFATSDTMRRVLRDQRAALMSQLAADDVLSEDPKRFLRAYETLKAAAKLRPEDRLVRRAVFQNLRAAAERVIALRAEKGDEAGLVGLAGEAAASGLTPEDRSGLRAFALSEVARLRIEQGDYDGAVKTIDLALREQLGPRDKDLGRILTLNRIAALRLAALRQAEAGALDAGLAYLERLARLSLDTAQRAQLEADRLRVIHLVGNARLDALDYDGAAKVYREGLRRFPRDETSRHNLVAVLERQVTPLVKEARCAEAQPLLQEIELLEPTSKFAKQARVRCLVARAKERLDADDPAEAVRLLAEARKKTDDPGIRDALAVAYAKWIQALVTRGDCAPARARASTLTGLGHARWGKKRVRALLGSCRP